MISDTAPDATLRASFEEAYIDAAALQEQMFEIADPDAFANVSNYFVASLVCPRSRVSAKLTSRFLGTLGSSFIRHGGVSRPLGPRTF
jgi:hypothetical protein